MLTVSKVGRKNVNDDTVKILQERGAHVFVGDGLGGYAGGQMAFSIVADTMIAAVQQENLLSEDKLIQVVNKANEAVKNCRKRNREACEPPAFSWVLKTVPYAGCISEIPDCIIFVVES